MTSLSLKSKSDLFNNADTLLDRAFVCTTFDISSGATSAENPRVLIKNPIGSLKNLSIYKLAMTTNVSTNNNSFRFYTKPTITNNGTVVTPRSLNLKTIGASSTMQMFTIPTVTNNGLLLMNFTVGPVSTLVIPFEKMIVIQEGESILVNIRPNTSGVTFTLDVFWIET